MGNNKTKRQIHTYRMRFVLVALLATLASSVKVTQAPADLFDTEVEAEAALPDAVKKALEGMTPRIILKYCDTDHSGDIRFRELAQCAKKYLEHKKVPVPKGLFRAVRHQFMKADKDHS